ncbi:MAG: hypothetical protein FWE24_07975 [Defluviitaleaceae bacterium]|nr:hypothetical protein [Defluviitaleaceae bacterium]
MADGTKFQRVEYIKAYEKIEKLTDPGSFSQIGAYMSDDNVLAGFATIDTRPLYIYCQYGSVTISHAEKISRIYAMAVSMGSPIVSILDSEGLSMESGMDVLASYGEIFSTMANASGVIPQLSLIYGKCMGANAVISGLSDFSFGLKDSRLFVQSPNTAEDIKSVGLDNFMSAAYHFNESGQLNFLFDNEEAMNIGFKQFLSFMPSNNLEEVPILVGNDMEFDTASLSAGMSPVELINALCDNDEYIELGAGYGSEIAAFLTRFDGCTTLTAVGCGELSRNSIDKLTKLAAFSNAFNIPIVTFTNTKGFKTGVSEQKHDISAIAALSYALSNATVPKINIIIGDAIGLSGLTFNSKFIGADLVYAWSGANLALFTKEAAKVLGVPDTSTDCALKKGYVDEIIEPQDTRKYIIRAIDHLSTKRVSKHPKKHGSICF